MNLPIGTLVNAGAVVLGGLIGLGFRNLIPDHMRKIVFQAIGLFTIVLGVQMALAAEAVLVQIFALVLGAILGHGLKLEEGFGIWLDRFSKEGKNSGFSNALITAFVLYCMGSMTILGAMEEGLTGSREVLYTKSVLDGFSSIVLAAGMGPGILISAIPLLIFQSSITWTAQLLENHISKPMVQEISATGGFLILGIGLNLLEITKLKLLNFLPALVLAPILYWLVHVLF